MKVNNFILKFICTLTVIVLISFLFINTFKVYGSNFSEEYRIIVAEKGDTLWNIAKDNCNNTNDIRKAVYEIKKFNSITSANIYPGQKIKIPVKLYK